MKLKNGGWSFGGNLPNKFENHITKSVPHYLEGHQMIVRLSDYFLKERSVCYDIGCSTGNLLKKISAYSSKEKIKLIGIEKEKKMYNYAKSQINNKKIKLLNKDFKGIKLVKSDMIISYYTIQFIAPSIRQSILNKIFKSLNWGGAFIMFEKTRGNDARFQDIWTAIYSDFKIEQGYSPEEIINKSRSLKGVLEPFSMKGNFDLLKRSGFEDIATIFKYVPFAGIISIK